MTSNSKRTPLTGLVRLGQQLSSAELESANYQVHGITTRVTTNSPDVSRAVATLFKPFPGNSNNRPDIEFHLFVVDQLTKDMAPIPASASLMYDWDTVKILHDGNDRYLQVNNYGRTRVRAGSPEEPDEALKATPRADIPEETHEALKTTPRARVRADIPTRTAVGFAESGLLVSDWLISNVFFYPLWGQLLKESGLFPLHAAGVARDGRGFLFLGRSGSGKSTLTLNLVRAGYGLLSDDTVFLRMTASGQVEALCFPEELNVTEQTLKLIPELARVKNFTVNELRQKSSFSIEELYPGCVVESTIPALMVFPEIADTDATFVEPMSRTEALALSMRYGYLFMDHSTTGRHFEILSQLAKQAQCYRLLAGRDQKKLSKALDNLLSGAGHQG